jgi:hypothetical protein
MRVKLTIVGLYSMGIGKTEILGDIVFNDSDNSVEVSNEIEFKRLENYTTVEVFDGGFVLTGSDNTTTDFVGSPFRDTWYDIKETFWKIEVVSI